MCAAPTRGFQKVPDLQALLRFVRSCLPQDFGTSITIARCRACDATSILPAVTGNAGTPRLRRRVRSWGRRRLSEGGGRVTGYRDSNVPREGAADPIARSKGDGAGMEEKRRAIDRRPAPASSRRSHAQRNRAVVRSAMSGKGLPAIPRPQENEGVGEHVRTRFHDGPKAACEIAELLAENRTERRKLVSSAGPQTERSDR